MEGENFLSSGSMDQDLPECFFFSCRKSVSKSCRIFMLSSSPIFRHPARTAKENKICRRINMDTHHTFTTVRIPKNMAKSHKVYIRYFPDFSGAIFICRIVSPDRTAFSHRIKRFPRKVLRPYLAGASFRFSPGQRRNTVFFSMPQ